MDPNVILSFNRPVGKTTDDVLNPQSAFLNALKIKNRPGSSQIGTGTYTEGPAKRLTLDENGRIVEADDFNNNVRLPPEIP